jgi:hypothetical protein
VVIQTSFGSWLLTLILPGAAALAVEKNSRVMLDYLETRNDGPDKGSGHTLSSLGHPSLGDGNSSV